MKRKYKIISSVDTSMLEEIVQNYLNAGWELHGGLVAGLKPGISGSNLEYSQVMIATEIEQ